MFWVWLWRAWLARHWVSPCWIRTLAYSCPPAGAGSPSAWRWASQPAVEHAAREARRVEVVGQAHRRDRRQPRGSGPGHEHLGDPREGDAHHPHLVVCHPGLRRSDLHGVVAVVGGGKVEEVERPTGAAGAAHLEADGGEAQQGCHQRAHHGGRIRHQWVGRGLAVLVQLGVDEAVGRGDGVARLLDHGRERSVGQGLPRREPYGGRQRHPVAHRDVVESHRQVLALIEGRRGRVTRGEDPEAGGGSHLGALDCSEAVPGAGGHVPDDQAPLAVHRPVAHLAPGAVDQHD